MADDQEKPRPRYVYFWNGINNSRYEYVLNNGNYYLTPESVAQVAYDAGFRGQALLIAVAVAGRESTFSPVVQGSQADPNKILGDRGLWQINSTHDEKLVAQGILSDASATGRVALFDPMVNAKAAFFLSQGGTYWSPWSAAPKVGYDPSGDYLYGTNVARAAEAIIAAGLKDELAGWAEGTRPKPPAEPLPKPAGYPIGYVNYPEELVPNAPYGSYDTNLPAPTAPGPSSFEEMLSYLREVNANDIEVSAQQEQFLRDRLGLGDDGQVSVPSDPLGRGRNNGGFGRGGDVQINAATTTPPSNTPTIRQAEGPGTEPSRPAPSDPLGRDPNADGFGRGAGIQISDAVKVIADNLQPKYRNYLLDPNRRTGLTAQERAILDNVRANPNGGQLDLLRPMALSGITAPGFPRLDYGTVNIPGISSAYTQQPPITVIETVLEQVDAQNSVPYSSSRVPDQGSAAGGMAPSTTAPSTTAPTTTVPTTTAPTTTAPSTTAPTTTAPTTTAPSSTTTTVPTTAGPIADPLGRDPNASSGFGRGSTADPLGRDPDADYGFGRAPAPVTETTEPTTTTTTTTTFPSTGSVSTGGTSTIPQIDTEDWEKAAAEIYPAYYAIIQNNPEIKELIKKSLGPPRWSQEKFYAELYNTNWYKTTSYSAREWALLSAQDPAEANARVQQQASGIRQSANFYGVSLSEEQILQLATDAQQFGFDTLQITNAIGMKAIEAGTPGITDLSNGYYGQNMRLKMADYGVTLSDVTFNNYLNKIAVGAETLDSFQDYVMTLGKTLYPALAAQFDAGKSFSELTDVYRQTASRVLEVDPDSIDFTDPQWQRAITYTDDKSPDQRMMSATEWGDYLRSTPAFGYQYTDGAKQKAYQTANRLAELFGKV